MQAQSIIIIGKNKGKRSKSLPVHTDFAYLRNPKKPLKSRLPGHLKMEIGGLEPLTYTLRTYRSPN